MNTAPEVLDELERIVADNPGHELLRTLLADSRQMAASEARADEAERLLRLSCLSACEQDTGDGSLVFVRNQTSRELADCSLAIDCAVQFERARAAKAEARLADVHGALADAGTVKVNYDRLGDGVLELTRERDRLLAANERLTRERDNLWREVQDYCNMLGTWQEATGCSHGDAARRKIDELLREHAALKEHKEELRARLVDDVRTVPQPIPIDTK